MYSVPASHRGPYIPRTKKDIIFLTLRMRKEMNQRGIRSQIAIINHTQRPADSKYHTFVVVYRKEDQTQGCSTTELNPLLFKFILRQHLA